MTPLQITLLVVSICIFDAVVISLLVRAMVSSNWNPIAERHPAREPAFHAERRSFQSFKLGIFNLGWSVHVAVDADHLHLTPVKPLRLLGMKPLSMAWPDVELVPGERFGKRRAIRVGVAKELVGPAWCFERASRAS